MSYKLKSCNKCLIDIYSWISFPYVNIRRTKPCHNDISLYDVSSITTDTVPINSSLWTAILNSSLITTFLYNEKMSLPWSYNRVLLIEFCNVTIKSIIFRNTNVRKNSVRRLQWFFIVHGRPLPNVQWVHSRSPVSAIMY